MTTIVALLSWALAGPPAGAPASREKEALWTAIDDLRRTIVMYDAVLMVQDKRRPFSWVVRQKRRHVNRLVAIAKKLGHGDPPVLWDASQYLAPTDRVEACAGAKRQELRNIAIYETSLGVVSAPSARAHLRRMLQKTRYRQLVAFEACIAAG